MVTLTDLHNRGYFPKELPPPFHASSYAKAISRAESFPSSFSQPRVAQLGYYNLARAGTLRRRLGFPNPIHYYNLCQEVELNWISIESQLKKTPLAGIVPTGPGKTGRAIISSHVDKFVSLRANSRATARFLLKADISRFYHSIYTHSIPWALHGKEAAKADRSKSLYGNRLDTLARKCQHNQTLGLPIGPDTSFILSEVILSAVDEILLTKVKKLNGFRHIDDYELCFDTRSRAEQALAALQEALTEFELALNPVKTRIYELPLPLDKPWVSELRNFRFRRKSLEYDLVTFFDRAYVLTKDNPDESVLNYAIARTNSVNVDHENWELYQNLLVHCIRIEPNTLIPGLEQLLRYDDAGYRMNKTLITTAMNKQIKYHAPLGHNSEVAWALWALIAFCQ